MRSECLFILTCIELTLQNFEGRGAGGGQDIYLSSKRSSLPILTILMSKYPDNRSPQTMTAMVTRICLV